MRCLLAEDDSELRENLARALVAAGFTVDAVADGQDALFHISEFAYAVAVLDLGLPQITGLDVIRRCRQAGIRTPILVLTARTRVAQVVEALEAGADDYLKKPVDPSELIAHLAAVMRRAENAEALAQTDLYFGRFRLHTRRRELLCDDKAVNLTAAEYAILELLWCNNGRVMSKREIAESYQRDPDIEMSANSVEALIGRIKRKSAHGTDEKSLPLVTVRGLGYLFDGEAE